MTFQMIYWLLTSVNITTNWILWAIQLSLAFYHDVNHWWKIHGLGQQTPTDTWLVSHKSHPWSYYWCASVGPGTISDYYLHIRLISRSNWQHSSLHPAGVLLVVTLDKLWKLIILFWIKNMLLILMAVEVWGQRHTLKQYWFLSYFLFVLLKKLVRDETPGYQHCVFAVVTKDFPTQFFISLAKLTAHLRM